MSDSPARATVPQFDLSGQYPSIRDEAEDAVLRVLASGRFILGPEVEALEREIAEYCGCAHAVGMSSGTDALLAAMMALGIGHGDEVITTPFTFFATAGCIHRLGARPVFVDIEPGSFNIDPERIAAALTPKTRAILPVHLFGQIAAMDEICEIACRNELPVIEDAAQAIGAELRGRRAGSLGLLGCFSFYPTKNLGAAGDAGIVTTNDPGLAEALRRIRNHGMEPRYYHADVGGNFRLDAVQAAVLRVKLRHLEAWQQARRGTAALYRKRFAEAGLARESPGAGDGIVLPPELPDRRHVYHQFVIRAPRRDALRAHLAARGIGSEIYYPLALHEQECFRPLGHKKGDFPEAERAAAESLALPMFPELTPAQVDAVVAGVGSFFGAGTAP